MSKLLNLYKTCKGTDKEKIYIFKSGVFYISLDNDAIFLSQLLGFKLTRLNDTTIKCGFPTSRLEYYINLLKQNNVNFQIIDPNYDKVNNFTDYINNENVKKIILKLINLDINNITFKQSFDILYNVHLELQKIYKE